MCIRDRDTGDHLDDEVVGAEEELTSSVADRLVEPEIQPEDATEQRDGAVTVVAGEDEVVHSGDVADRDRLGARGLGDPEWRHLPHRTGIRLAVGHREAPSDQEPAGRGQIVDGEVHTMLGVERRIALGVERRIAVGVGAGGFA